MTRDEFLTTKVLGECWHDKLQWVGSRGWRCGICGECPVGKNPNFSTPEGFFNLWNFCKEQSWWIGFTHDFCQAPRGWNVISTYFINPDIFADAIARYRGWEGE